MKFTVLSPAEVHDLAALLYAALRPGSRPPSPPAARVRHLLRRARAAGRAVPVRRAG